MLSNDPAHPSNLWFRSFKVNFNTTFDLDVVSNNSEIQSSENTVFNLRQAERTKNDDNSSVGAFGIPGSHFIETRGKKVWTDPISQTCYLGDINRAAKIFLAFDMSVDNFGGSRVYLPWSGSADTRSAKYNYEAITGLKLGEALPVKINRTTPDDRMELSKIFFGASAGLDRRKGILPIAVDDFGKISSRIRAYKYGLKNVIPENPSFIFKRDHYGYFSDLIETPVEAQLTVRPIKGGHADDENALKQFGVTTSPPIFVRFVDSNGESVNPEETPSSNLSFYCTSSAPYFDNQVKDRYAPPEDFRFVLAPTPNIITDFGDGSGFR